MTIPRNTITGDVSTGYRPAPIPKPPKKKPPRKPPLPNFGGGYDPYAATTTQVNAIIQSMLDSVKSDKAAAAAQAQQEAAAAYARGQALAYGLQKLGIANNVQAIFQNAMNAGSGLASGFSGATRDQAAAQAADQAKTLVGTGQEGAVRNEGDAMGNVIYGLGGYIPGNKLNTLGAAFGAQAALQPGFAEQFGALDQARILNDWASKGASTYDQQIQKIIGEKPSLFMSTLAQNRNYANQERNWKYQVWKDQMNIAMANGAKPTARTLANGQIQWFDSLTGKPIGQPQGPTRTANSGEVITTVNGRRVIVDKTTRQVVADLGPAGSAPAGGPSKTVQSTYRQSVGGISADISNGARTFDSLLTSAQKISVKYGDKVQQYVTLKAARKFLFQKYWPELNAAGAGPNMRKKLMAAITRLLRQQGYRG